MNKRMALLSAVLALAVNTLAIPLASAQTESEIKAQIEKLKPKDFPTQPIELTVVYPAGGGMDINARFVAKYFEKVTSQKVIVNNRTGGAGLVGHTYLATQAKNDGYSVGVIANFIFADSMLRAQGRWTYNDVEPIAFLNSDGLSLVVNSEGPFKSKTMKEMIELAKQKPGTVRISTVPGSMYEYMVDQLELVTGAKFLKVPFQGGSPALAALLGNSIDLSIAFYAEITGMLEAKKVTPVAVSSAERSPFLPNTPTLNETLGSKDIVWIATRWVAVPKGMAADRKAYLVAAFTAAARDPELQVEFRKLGTVPDPRIATPAQLTEHLNKLAALEREFYVKTGRLK
jgi:tripartite-type tricarboxylate transporter receptor subunit TctC